MKATKQIDIYLAKKHNVRLIDVVQYDTGIQLVFTVKDFTIPSGATATLYVQKPSGKFVFQEDGITIADNTITIDLENQAITEHGKVPYQVSITSGSDVITTFTGLMMVEKSLKDSGATESKTVIHAFDELTAEKVAEFQTKAEQIVQACIATLPDDYTTMEAKVNELANAVKGYLSGAVVVADDVSPVEHELGLRIRGKNFFNRNNYIIMDGVILFDISNLVVGRKYVFSSNLPVTWFKISNYPSGYNSIAYSDAAGMTVIPFTMARNKAIPEDVPQYLILSVNTNYASNAVKDLSELDGYNIQIEEGETPTDYEPWLDPATVTLTRCGKSVFAKSKQEFEQTAGAWGSILVAKIKAPPGNYVASCSFVQAGTDKSKVSFSVRDYDDTTAIIGSRETMDTVGTCIVPFTVAEGKKGFQIYLYSNATANVLTTKCVFSNIMVEVGSTATNYRPYEGATYIPVSDGTVSGVTSLSPNMTILTDTEGVIVECEYNRDTNKVIDKLTKAITALGGAV